MTGCSGLFVAIFSETFKASFEKSSCQISCSLRRRMVLVSWAHPTDKHPCALILLRRMQSSTKKAHLWAHTLPAGMDSLSATVFVVLQTRGDVRRQGLGLACRELFKTGRFGATRKLFWRWKCWINTLHFSLRRLCAKVSPSLSFPSSDHIQVIHCLVLKDSIFC